MRRNRNARWATKEERSSKANGMLGVSQRRRGEKEDYAGKGPGGIRRRGRRSGGGVKKKMRAAGGE